VFHPAQKEGGLDHGNIDLAKVHEINVTSFIDVILAPAFASAKPMR
jgi:hypothetical protein